MTPINLYDCAPNCDLTKVINTSRATWVCAKCGRDVSMMYLFFVDAVKGDE